MDRQSNCCDISAFKAGGVLLKKKSGLLIIYGPFSRNGVIEPESNVAFHRSLLQQDSDWGLRDTSYLSQVSHIVMEQFKK